MSTIIEYAETNTTKFNDYKKLLLNTTNNDNSYALVYACQNKIGGEFVNNAINNATYLFVNKYLGDIIGFASVMYYIDENDSSKTYLYIELICNAPDTRSLETKAASKIIRAGAMSMIKSIEKLARELNCSYIKLNAIDAVIPYYFKLGFNFKTVYNNNGEEINEYLKTKASNLIQELRSSQQDNNTEAEEKAMVRIIQRFYPGYLSEDNQLKLSTMTTGRTGPARDQGIPMIKMLVPEININTDNDRWENPLRGGKKTKKVRISVPKRYIPKGLTRKDKNKQRDMLKKSRRMYKNGKYYTRKHVKSFKSKKSSHIINAQKIYKVNKIYPNKQLSAKTGCSVNALSKIVKKGEGAYYSSGSRPNQTAQSWGYARLASAITGGKSSAVDYKILKDGCKSTSRALKLAKKAKKKFGYGKGKTPQTKL